MQREELHSIAYFEQRVIGQIIASHHKELGDKLHALIAFGDQLTQGNTVDIDLLEVVDGWSGDRVAEFPSTEKLPMRGKLRLYFLETKEFTTPEQISDLAIREWAENLIARVKEGYQILFETPGLFATMALIAKTDISMLSTPASGIIHASDPFSIPNLSALKAR